MSAEPRLSELRDIRTGDYVEHPEYGSVHYVTVEEKRFGGYKIRWGDSRTWHRNLSAHKKMFVMPMTVGS
jgi:hypothetical protein